MYTKDTSNPSHFTVASRLEAIASRFEAITASSKNLSPKMMCDSLVTHHESEELLIPQIFSRVCCTHIAMASPLQPVLTQVIKL